MNWFLKHRANQMDLWSSSTTTMQTNEFRAIHSTCLHTAVQVKKIYCIVKVFYSWIFEKKRRTCFHAGIFTGVDYYCPCAKNKHIIMYKSLKYNWMPFGCMILHENVINYSTFINAQGRARFQSSQIVECYPHADTTRTCLFTQDNRRTFFCFWKPCHPSVVSPKCPL